jgi:hypothetical protein
MSTEEVVVSKQNVCLKVKRVRKEMLIMGSQCKTNGRRTTSIFKSKFKGKKPMGLTRTIYIAVRYPKTYKAKERGDNKLIVKGNKKQEKNGDICPLTNVKWEDKRRQ